MVDPGGSWLAVERRRVLEFYADVETGWTGVVESIMPDNPSVLAEIGEDTPALEVFLRATPDSYEVPAALLDASERATNEVHAIVQRAERGSLDQLDVLSQPQAALPAWCATVQDFIAAYCSEVGIYDDHACIVYWSLTAGGAGALTSDPALAYHAAYCHTSATSVSSLQYRDLTHGSASPEYACQPLNGWNTVWSGITDVSKNMSWGGGDYPREYRLSRYAFVNSVGHYGHEWAAEDCN